MIENANFQTMIGSSAFAQASNPQNLDGSHQSTMARAAADKEEKEKDAIKDTFETQNKGVEAQEGDGGAGGGSGAQGETENEQDPDEAEVLEKDGDSRAVDGRGVHLDITG